MKRASTAVLFFVVHFMVTWVCALNPHGAILNSMRASSVLRLVASIFALPLSFGYPDTPFRKMSPAFSVVTTIVLVNSIIWGIALYRGMISETYARLRGDSGRFAAVRRRAIALILLFGALAYYAPDVRLHFDKDELTAAAEGVFKATTPEAFLQHVDYANFDAAFEGVYGGPDKNNSVEYARAVMNEYRIPSDALFYYFTAIDYWTYSVSSHPGHVVFKRQSSGEYKAIFMQARRGIVD